MGCASTVMKHSSGKPSALKDARSVWGGGKAAKPYPSPRGFQSDSFDPCFQAVLEFLAQVGYEVKPYPLAPIWQN